MKYVSQALLESTYRKYNKKYFGNKLPKDIDLRFGYTHGCLGYQLGEEIVLSKNKAYRRDSIWRGTLLHEMAHLCIEESHDHGPRWQKEMMRLARVGALRDVW